MSSSKPQPSNPLSSGIFRQGLQPAGSGKLLSLALSIALAAALSGVTPLAPKAWAQYGEQSYGDYFEQGSNYYNKGELSKSIDAFKRALPLAQDESVTMVYNNLAAAYIKRGNYYQETAAQYDNALSDFRNALYYLDYAWPEGTPRKSLHERNLSAANTNLNNVYQLLKLNPADKNMHQEQARRLRQNGSLTEAIVEYAQVLKLDKSNPEALKAMGDLFNVVNMPHKSKKYYELAGNAMGDSLSDELLVQQGNTLYKTGEIDKAVIAYNKALEINPANPSALNQLEKIWTNEIKFNPSSVLGHANLAGIYQKKKNYDLALQQYNAAEHFAEANRSTPFEVKKLIRLNMGTLFQEKKQYQLANSAYSTVLQVEPNNVLALTYKASLSKEVGNPDEAISLYNKILSVDPNNATARHEMFDLVKQQGTPAKVVDGLKQYADRFAQNATVQSQVGEEFHRMKDYDNAALYYQRAIQLDPKLAAAHANLGVVYDAQGKTQESLAALKKAQALDPNNKTVAELTESIESNLTLESFKKAVELQQAGNHSEALGYFKQALAKTPDNADLIAAYGVSLQNTEQSDEAIRQYQKAVQLSPNNGSFQYYLGTAYHQKNLLPQALSAYKKAVQLDSSLKDAADAIAMIEQHQGAETLQQAVDAYSAKQYPKALTLINQVLSKDKTNATAHYYKGLILSAQKNERAAAASYRESLNHDPNFADAYYALGISLDSQNDFKGAEQAFQKYVELSTGKDDDFVKYAQDRLKQLSSK